jgi:aspartyl-tRNA(Asn)/glutamyl-tRNA(Gln) amidotransferase subunit B
MTTTPFTAGFETVIGLEVHLQLRTDSKLFCGSANKFGEAPNSAVSPVNMGLPGTLPVVNEKAVAYAIKTGLALNCAINRKVKFDRKNYFYPDCPKAYQISQFDYPINKDGFIMIPVEGGKKKIGITRAHLEEDAGKLLHEADCSLVDYNRAGTPLLEIVSEPDLRSPQEAYDYLQTLKLIISYLDVSDCDMEKGSLRCDANVSIRPDGQRELGTKTELKNLNSFKAVKAALEYEVGRQRAIVLSGQSVRQETLLWDENRQATAIMRSKEEAHDYRYFPEPDLVPFMLKDSWIEEIRKTLPELPDFKFARFVGDYRLSGYDAGVLVQDRSLADFFEQCQAIVNDPKKTCNWITGALLKELNTRRTTIRNLSLKPQDLADIISNVESGALSNLAGKDILTMVIDGNASVGRIIRDKGLAQVSDEEELEKIITALIEDHAAIADQIRSGKEAAIGFLVGQAMKKTQGKANPKIINELIKRRLLDG